MNISTYCYPYNDRVSVMATFEPSSLDQAVGAALIDRIVEQLAEKIVAEHGQEIIATLDMQAIANLTVARAAEQIASTLKADAKTNERLAEYAIQREFDSREMFGFHPAP